MLDWLWNMFDSIGKSLNWKDITPEMIERTKELQQDLKFVVWYIEIIKYLTGANISIITEAHPGAYKIYVTGDRSEKIGEAVSALSFDKLKEKYAIWGMTSKENNQWILTIIAKGGWFFSKGDNIDDF